jgi:UDP:flavonoid glycosyltransferase YjiC (YdhE family)
MAHILIVTSEITSHYYSVFALAQRLQAAGQRVTCASPADLHGLASALGVPFVHLSTGPHHTPPSAEPAGGRLNKVVGWFAKWLTMRQRRAQALAALGTEEFAAVLRELAPDLCIVDHELNGYIMTAVPRGIPTALFSPMAALRKYPGVPPLHLGIVPGQGWHGSAAGIEWAWLRYRLWKVWHTASGVVRSAGTDPFSILRTYARTVGFPFAQEIDVFQWLLPFSYRTLPVLVFNPLELDFPYVPHPTVTHIGPLILHNRPDALSDPTQQAVGDELEGLFVRRRADNSRALIYCAFGASFQGDDSAFFRRVIASVADQPTWDVIMGAGGRLNPAALGDLPPNVHVFAWVPQPQVLQYADCAVIHGGIGTIHECIYAGVPMLAYPFKRTNDQMGSAARITYHRLGIVSDRDTDDASAIRRHISALLTDNTYRASVREKHSQMQRYTNDRVAERAVERLLVVRSAQHGTRDNRQL